MVRVVVGSARPHETIRRSSHPDFNYLLYSDPQVRRRGFDITTEKWKGTKDLERVRNVMKGYRGSLPGMVKPVQVRPTEDCKKEREAMEGVLMLLNWRGPSPESTASLKWPR